jgi:energy-coupling factor transporter ATP-binding protein EcfA2
MLVQMELLTLAVAAVLVMKPLLLLLWQMVVLAAQA